MPSSAKNASFELDWFKRSACIDFIKVFSPHDFELPIDAAKVKRRPLRAEGHSGVEVTIHDPTPVDLDALAAVAPDAVISEIEVSLDLRPRGTLNPDARRALLNEAQHWLITHLYPWDGPGLQYAARASGAIGHARRLEYHGSFDRPGFSETLYLGHSDPKYADSRLPNFASMRLYVKRTDRRKPLPPCRWSTRAEVTLARSGCKHFNIETLADIRGFGFRELGPYFRLIRPGTVRGGGGLRRVLKADDPLGRAIQARRIQVVETILRSAGAYALHDHAWASIHSHRNHALANRAMREAFDNLTRRFAAEHNPRGIAKP